MKTRLPRLMKQLALRTLMAAMPNVFIFKQRGFCPCCRSETYFISLDPWLRDHFECINCKSIPRNRALITVLEKYYRNWEALLIHESSPSGGGASARLRQSCCHYVASQYYPNHPFGIMVGEFRNEDLEHQTYADSTFDIVITQDVLEHVYDPASAFREIARTLKPGGAHIFSVPLVSKNRPTQVWATRNQNGTPNFLHEPDYHANPVDPHGSPVTMRWGYDIVNFIKNASGLDTNIEYVDNLYFGIRAEFIEILVSQKPLYVGQDATQASTEH